MDAHADTSDMILGEKIGHGTPFRRCVDEGSWTARGSSRLGSEAQVILQIIMSGAEHRYHDVLPIIMI